MFNRRVAAAANVGSFSGILPSVSDWARVTGHNPIFVDDHDPLRHSFQGAFPHFVRATTLEVVQWIPRDDGADLVETSLLIQGLICAREFFSGDTPQESDLRERINRVCDVVDWSGFVRPGARPSLYWHWSTRRHLNTPITGWNEALIAYVLAAGSESSPIDPEVYHVGWGERRQASKWTVLLRSYPSSRHAL
ncbi:proline racemase family protein [Rhizobium leguminosarum]|uniref:proline racemase family protein n=1 Tax=Rhizobium leguminosarum TaxID=384 RepID=UPI003D7C2549